ncbi:MAG TPA: NUDIX domain-containing protein [Stellaceae bacterium]|nr:NUDIX domain-containing protein [Stellaceae bacterium]
MSDAGVEILERDVAYQGFFRIDRYRLRHRLYAGGWSGVLTREVFERGRTVGVLLYDPERDAVVLVEQFRLPAHLAGFSGWQVEIVAGIVDRDGEAEAAVALREAQEEAGLAIAGALVPVHRYMPSPGGSSEIIDLFCGRVDARGAGGIHGLAAEHEDIKVVVLAYREAMQRLKSDAIQNGPTVLALHWLAANRARLRRLWRPAP